SAVVVKSGANEFVISLATSVTAPIARLAIRFIPISRPCIVYSPNERNTRDGELMPSRFLAPAIASPTTDLAASTAAPAIFLIPFISPRIKSAPALTISPTNELTDETIWLPIDTTALTALAPPETIAETNCEIHEFIFDTIFDTYYN